MEKEINPVEFKIFDRTFLAESVVTKKETSYWDYPGREIEPLGDDLPEVLLCEGEEIKFTQVTNSKTGKSKPLSKARQANGLISHDGFELEISCRITRMKKGVWYLWLRASGMD